MPRFDYWSVAQRAVISPFFDAAPQPWTDKLRIIVTPAVVKVGEPFWRAIAGYHLPDSGGNPNIYLCAVNLAGTAPIHKLTTGQASVFGWTWEGRRPDEPARPVVGDKGIDEPSANINLGRGQIVTCWVEDTIPSDRVGNLRSDWPDRLYHAATLVVFQLTIKGASPPDPSDDPPPTGGDYEEGYEAGADEVKSRVQEVLDKL